MSKNKQLPSEKAASKKAKASITIKDLSPKGDAKVKGGGVGYMGCANCPAPLGLRAK